MINLLRVITIVLALLCGTVGLRNLTTTAATPLQTSFSKVVLMNGGGDPPPGSCPNYPNCPFWSF